MCQTTRRSPCSPRWVPSCRWNSCDFGAPPEWTHRRLSPDWVFAHTVRCARSGFRNNILLTSIYGNEHVTTTGSGRAASGETHRTGPSGLYGGIFCNLFKKMFPKALNFIFACLTSGEILLHDDKAMHSLASSPPSPETTLQKCNLDRGYITSLFCTGYHWPLTTQLIQFVDSHLELNILT